jgi:hypothetical protein
MQSRPYGPSGCSSAHEVPERSIPGIIVAAVSVDRIGQWKTATENELAQAAAEKCVFQHIRRTMVWKAMADSSEHGSGDPGKPSDYAALADYLKFAREQVEQDRKDFKHHFDWTVKFLAFILLIVGVPVGFFGFRSLDQLITEVRSSTKAEVDAAKVEREAMKESLHATVTALQETVQNQRDTMRSSLEATREELRATTQKELDGVRVAVNKRADDEFRTEQITSLVRNVAKQRTEAELAGIIRSEVALGIKAQQAFVQSTVESQTKAAVQALEPTISSSVAKATEDQVNKSVLPIQTQMAGYADYIRIGTLAMLANGDDRHAFDTLVQIVLGKTKESRNPDFVHLADATLGTIISAKTSGMRMTRSFNTPQTPDSLKQMLHSQSPWEREAALDNYPPNDKSVLPILVELIKSDGSIDVLVRAVEHFNGLTKQTFRFHQTDELLGWWQKNEESFR